MNDKTKGRTLWFFGLPAAGKSTLAKSVVNDSGDYVLLDGDEVRQTVVNFNMDQSARLLHLSYMAFCCRQLNECGTNVAAAFVTSMNSYRSRIREDFARCEIHLAAVRVGNLCGAQLQRTLERAASANMPHLTGAGGEREEPTDGALMLQTDSMTVEKAFWRIKERLSLV